MNRRGDWHNFHYWHGLGFGTRRETVTRSSKQVGEVKVLVEAVLRDSDLSSAHGFLNHFSSEFEKSVTELYQWSQALGEGAYLDQLGEDFEYWRKCQGRWGGGPGYKSEISRWTSSWFSEESRKDRTAFIEAEVQRRWKELVEKLDAQLTSAESSGKGKEEAALPNALLALGAT